MREEKFFVDDIDMELIDTDFDNIDPYGEIMMDDVDNRTHDFDDVVL